MPLIELKISECPCARVGSRRAKLVMPTHPELAECTWCRHPVWLTPVAKDSGIPLVCTDCLESKWRKASEIADEIDRRARRAATFARFRTFFRFLGRRIGPIEAWVLADAVHDIPSSFDPPCVDPDLWFDSFTNGDFSDMDDDDE